MTLLSRHSSHSDKPGTKPPSKLPDWVHKARAKLQRTPQKQSDVAGPIGRLGPVDSNNSVLFSGASDEESDADSLYSEATNGDMFHEVDLECEGPTRDGRLSLNFHWTDRERDELSDQYGAEDTQAHAGPDLQEPGSRAAAQQALPLVHARDGVVAKVAASDLMPDPADEKVLTEVAGASLQQAVSLSAATGKDAAATALAVDACGKTTSVATSTATPLNAIAAERLPRSLQRYSNQHPVDEAVECEPPSSGTHQPARTMQIQATADAADQPAPSADAYSQTEQPEVEFGPERPPVPPLRIVIMIAGTRGDVQPFIALGLKLQEYGHRVRLASHAVYRDFVQSFGLEFYPLGGDPKVLSDYIVKNRGIIPSSAKDAIDNYHQVKEIVMSTYAACTEPDSESGGEPFTAQAIIANPPAYGHIHCAEKLGIPLHMFFTMPWSPTKAFPHPLARLNNVKGSRMIGLRNYLSYIAINELLYSGMSPIFREFRVDTLHLTRLRAGHRAADLLTAHNVPFTYCWSEQLVPKPSDWGHEIDVVGYFFLEEGVRGHYEPPQEVADFLAAGLPPVYIGFGSLMVDHPQALTKMILDASERTGQRVILSRGWGGLGEGFDVPDSVLLIDAMPHDWLLPRCAAVVHHGGAGTTAAGLLASCPTFVVYFFGDQSFWGGACHKAGFGPKPVAIDKLTTDKMAEALTVMAEPSVRERVGEVAKLIRKEDGVAAGMEAFHAHLPLAYLKGERMKWNLTPPSMHNFLSETGAGVTGLVTEPMRGRKHGTKGVLKGIGKGLVGVGYRPLHGLYLAAQDISYRTAAAAKVMDRRCTHRYIITKASVIRSRQRRLARKSPSSSAIATPGCCATDCNDSLRTSATEPASERDPVVVAGASTSVPLAAESLQQLDLGAEPEDLGPADSDGAHEAHAGHAEVAGQHDGAYSPGFSTETESDEEEGPNWHRHFNFRVKSCWEPQAES